MSLLGTGAAAMAGRYKNTKSWAGGGGSGGQPTCQRCLQQGHWTYECKNAPVYIARPTRTQQIKNPKVGTRFLAASELPPELRDKVRPGEEAEGKRRENSLSKPKRKRESYSSSSESDSESGTAGSSSSSSSSDSGSDTSSGSDTTSSGSSGPSSSSGTSSSGGSSSNGSSSSSSSSGSESDSDSSSGSESDSYTSGSSSSSSSSGSSSSSDSGSSSESEGEERVKKRVGRIRDSPKWRKDRGRKGAAAERGGKGPSGGGQRSGSLTPQRQDKPDNSREAREGRKEAARQLKAPPGSRRRESGEPVGGGEPASDGSPNGSEGGASGRWAME